MVLGNHTEIPGKMTSVIRARNVTARNGNTPRVTFSTSILNIPAVA
jgi:hypothetical protein